ncbi:MAG TPA: tetratricopeptide repeat protein [Candidatus Acidoferrum sp.]|nr:tetratricopeptide repeat protein [Candidatus Acidoferrum sp.]
MSLALLALPRSSAAQSTAETIAGAAKQFEATGQLTVQVQDTLGAPFFQGASVTLLTRDIHDKLLTTSDPSGHARFTLLPIGAYLLEIAAPGYRTVQRQVLVSGTSEAQDIVVSLVPMAGVAKVTVGSVSVSPKALKESEKALRALQLNKLDEAHQHLAQALALDANFADANYLMGVLLLRRKQPARAGAYLQKSLTLSPGHTAALLALGEAQYLSGDYAHASNSLEEYLRSVPSSPQAPIAQRYLDAMRRMLQARVASGKESVPPTNDSSPSPLDESKTGVDSAATNPPPLDLTPDPEVSWAPPDVDAEKLDVDPSASCQLAQVMQSVSQRVQQLVQNVDRYTATENIQHFEPSPMGLRTSRETRKFNYVVEIHQVGKTDLNVQEYRSGWAPAEKIPGYPLREEFPGNIATVGLPSLALIFHPSLQDRYDFRCEGRGSWQAKPAWVVHFQQRAGLPKLARVPLRSA